MSHNVVFNTGDLFSTSLPAIGHGVNVYGVMGAGIAPIIRRYFPAVFEPYRAACLAKQLLPGQMLPVDVGGQRWVFNLASQDKPGPNARLEWFESSLRDSFRFATEQNIQGFAIPRIGAGIGGLSWDDVKSSILTIAADYPEITIEVWSLEGA